MTAITAKDNDRFFLHMFWNSSEQCIVSSPIHLVINVVTLTKNDLLVTKSLLHPNISWATSFATLGALR